MKRNLTILMVLLLTLTAACGAFAAELPKDDPEKNVEFLIWNYADDYKHYTSFEENAKSEQR